ncbi:MAG: hypothetical protein LBM71_01010, partial [Elusimicrobiota bacterium]|nr:hypothetical protein [Elusimicrobiota bacterium]
MKKILLISILFMPALIFAQMPVNPGRYLEEIQRRQQQEQQDILRQRDVEAAKKAQEAATKPAEATEIATEEPEGCLDIKKITVSGVKKINRKKVRKEVEAKIKPCMTKQDLQGIQTLAQQM